MKATNLAVVSGLQFFFLQGESFITFSAPREEKERLRRNRRGIAKSWDVLEYTQSICMKTMNIFILDNTARIRVSKPLKRMRITAVMLS
jgi:hypothetical protein